MLSKQNHAIITLTAMYCILSIVDAVSTLWGINQGLITEANPLMRLLITAGPFVFVVVKLAYPIIVELFCWMIRFKGPWISVFILWFAISVHSLVILVHFYWVTLAVSNMG